MTTYYAKPGGAGAGTGADFDNAWGESELADAMVSGGSLNLAAGDTVNLLTGTYAMAASINANNAGSSGSPIRYRGLANESGDPCTWANRPVLAFAAGTYCYLSNFNHLQDIGFTFNHSVGLRVYGGSHLLNCSAVQAHATGGAINFGTSYNSLHNCIAQAVGGPAFAGDTAYNMLNRCTAVGGSIGYSITARSIWLANCLAYGATTGVAASGSAECFAVSGCTIDDCTTGVAIGAEPCAAVNNCIISNCTNGLTASADNGIVADWNNVYGCDTDVSGFTHGDNLFDVDPLFYDAGGRDYRIGNRDLVGADGVTPLGACSLFGGGGSIV